MICKLVSTQRTHHGSYVKQECRRQCIGVFCGTFEMISSRSLSKSSGSRPCPRDDDDRTLNQTFHSQKMPPYFALIAGCVLYSFLFYFVLLLFGFFVYFFCFLGGGGVCVCVCVCVGGGGGGGGGGA